MERQVKIEGTSVGSIAIWVDGTSVKEVTFDQNLSADELFSILAFEKGLTYKFEKGEPKSATQSGFDAFADLMGEICKALNDANSSGKEMSSADIEEEADRLDDEER